MYQNTREALGDWFPNLFAMTLKAFVNYEF